MIQKTRLPVAIRRACPEDTPDVLELTSHIWDGEDYVPQAWESWLVDQGGKLLVAEMQGRVAGLCKLSHSGEQDWWLQGLRVHPDFEGHGIASQLHDALVSYWLENGSGFLRLSTHIGRVEVHHLCERTGFCRMGEYTFFQAEALADEQADFTPILADQAEGVLEVMLASPILDLTLGYMDLGWEWLPPNQAQVRAAIERGQALWWRKGAGLLLYHLEEEDEAGHIPSVSFISCARSLLVDLLLDFLRLAGKAGYAHAAWAAPLQTGLEAYLQQAGFERNWDGAVYLYEKKHPGRG